MKSLNEFFKNYNTLITEDKVQTICIDIPTFIRLMELAREDLTTDNQIHVLTTRLAEYGDTIDMEAFEELSKDLE